METQEDDVRASASLSANDRLAEKERKAPFSSLGWWVHWLFTGSSLKLLDDLSTDLSRDELPYRSVLPACLQFSASLASWGPQGEKSSKLRYPLIQTFFRLYVKRIVLIYLPHLLCLVCRLINPMLMYILLDQFSRAIAERETGWMLFVTFVLCVLQLAEAALHEGSWYSKHELRMECRRVIQYLVFEKVLRMEMKGGTGSGGVGAGAGGGNQGVSKGGESVSLSSLLGTDSEQLGQAVYQVFETPCYLIEFAIAAGYLYWVLGYVGIICFGAMLLLFLIPINFVGIRLNEKLDDKKCEESDRRVELVRESVENIRFIKAFGWEDLYEKKTMEVRRKEMRLYRLKCFIWGFVESSWATSGFFLTAACLLGYVIVRGKESINLTICLSVMTVVSAITAPIFDFSESFTVLSQANVSRRRILKFLEQDEVGKSNVGLNIDTDEQKREEDEEEDDVAVVTEVSKGHQDFGNELICEEKEAEDSLPDILLSNCSFAWPPVSVETDEEKKTDVPGSPPFLKDIAVRFNAGDFVGICGDVGSGKTCLAYALLGELRRVGGSMKVASSSSSSTATLFGFCSQEHWIRAKSVRENILFGAPFEAEKYEEVIRICQLTSDLEALPMGDHTLVGERGMRLSGGQQARVALARACYAVDSTDIFVFDDPLKDLDAAVTNLVFEKVFLGWLIGKTRILFTHNTQVLPKCDSIVVLDKGRIAHQGTFQELHERALGTSHQDLLLSPLSPLLEEGVEAKGSGSRGGEFHPHDDGDHERRMAEFGKRFDMKLFLSYFTTYPKTFAFVVLIVILKGIGEFGRDLLLSQLGSDEEKSRSFTFYIVSYLGVGIFVAVIIVIAQIVYTFMIMNVSSKYHDSMLNRVVRAPATWFDGATSGNIVSRFSKDQQVCDCQIRWRTREILLVGSWLFFTYFFVILYVPLVLVVLIPPFFVFFLFARNFMKALLAFIRLDATMHEPILSHCLEVSKGLSTIRAFRKQDHFLSEFSAILDRAWKVQLIESGIYRWICVRGRFVAIAILVLLVVLFTLIGGILQGSMAGLVVSKIFGMQFAITWLLLLIPQTMKNFVSVERIADYARIPTEPFGEGQRFELEKGKVEFRDVSFRYSGGEDDDTSTPDVLKNVSMVIPAGKKVGIVGRTGSGKSTMARLLFRLYETTEGTIFIDDVPLGQVLLRSLRSSLSYIAQNPTLLSGTVRENLDAESCFPDESVWSALEQVGLKEKITEKGGKLLDAIVGEDINFSAGEKQLLCFSRALLHKRKLLILDEATSSCDLGTDQRIQQTVNRCFPTSTIIAIAHRLETVIDYDLIGVMSEGSLVEIDAPSVLLENEDSLLFELVMQTGRRRSKRLFEMAQRRRTLSEKKESVENEQE